MNIKQFLESHFYKFIFVIIQSDLKQAFKSGNEEEVKATNGAVSSFIGNFSLFRAMKQFEENCEENKMAQILFKYMRMVERLQSFVYA